ncbi:DUF2971 domain-containing protein [Pseudorhodobacter sp. W20_MBD10_FR17]|uniref:DUF2971 domain-containing protein n=1 Tax=Pseudorhodobacter sp. W20_MBD10_FR17 TaxID=3240266 RepID=UPI003F955620
MAYLEFDPQQALFHYTNAAGFEGILRSKSLWLSDLTTTNDPREIVLGKSIVLEAMAKVRHERFPGSHGFPISIIAGNIVSYLSGHRIFSCSTTYKGDALPMWREYAEGGAGLSIGFRPRAIKDMPLRISKVHYIGSESSEAYAQLLYEILEPHLKSTEFPNRLTINVLCGEIAAKMASAKHASWEYEDEIRLSHAAPPDNTRTEVNGTVIPSFEYPDGKQFFSTVLKRTGAGGIQIAYIPLHFGKYQSGQHNWARSVKHVILGPKCAFGIEEVEQKLKGAGFCDFVLSRSECVLR